MEVSMTRLIAAALLLAVLPGCNTVAGLGKDLQAIGGAMTSTATDTANGTAKPAAPQTAPCATDSQGKTSPECRTN
jgi:predicted small secreted protein